MRPAPSQKEISILQQSLAVGKNNELEQANKLTLAEQNSASLVTRAQLAESDLFGLRAECARRENAHVDVHGKDTSAERVERRLLEHKMGEMEKQIMRLLEQSKIEHSYDRGADQDSQKEKEREKEKEKDMQVRYIGLQDGYLRY